MTAPCPLHPEQPFPCAPCGVNRVRAALNDAPRPRHHTTDPDPVRARAIQRARNERTKDQP